MASRGLYIEPWTDISGAETSVISAAFPASVLIDRDRLTDLIGEQLEAFPRGSVNRTCLGGMAAAENIAMFFTHFWSPGLVRKYPTAAVVFSAAASTLRDLVVRPPDGPPVAVRARLRRAGELPTPVFRDVFSGRDQPVDVSSFRFNSFGGSGTRMYGLETTHSVPSNAAIAYHSVCRTIMSDVGYNPITEGNRDLIQGPVSIGAMVIFGKPGERRKNRRFGVHLNEEGDLVNNLWDKRSDFEQAISVHPERTSRFLRAVAARTEHGEGNQSYQGVQAQHDAREATAAETEATAGVVLLHPARGQWGKNRRSRMPDRPPHRRRG